MKNLKTSAIPKGKRLVMSLIIGGAILFLLTGCGESSPIAGMVVSDQPYAKAAEIESAEQPVELKAGATIYASVSFIESPKGMTYQAKWLIDDKAIKTDEKAMATDKKGELVFPLEAEEVTAGRLKLQILYKDEVLAEKEVLIK
ncbi:hypothetical protein [Acetobacterium woodii]|uniref:Lipoprotein n=1 Tax=Acetobacterium woodii (strain ATCC 29683 / DSM 1030 / JCM 2381 / KCTC 1655 / WB1) TaxID=931626 RepID=H6LIF3_ACEWD|nr:hypothetical protein [Acetobacterium woodii]AFA47327.1 hypothetical protein Awo_c05280 [Acetobacterium woodii DSM 1030]